MGKGRGGRLDGRERERGRDQIGRRKKHSKERVECQSGKVQEYGLGSNKRVER